MFDLIELLSTGLDLRLKDKLVILLSAAMTTAFKLATLRKLRQWEKRPQGKHRKTIKGTIVHKSHKLSVPLWPLLTEHLWEDNKAQHTHSYYSNITANDEREFYKQSYCNKEEVEHALTLCERQANWIYFSSVTLVHFSNRS